MLICIKQSYAIEKIRLSSGYDIPAVGLGTSTIKIDDIDKAITSALENGYRHIDTAYNYFNEEAIGKALKNWFDKGGNREELFITSKLPDWANRPESVEKYLKRSLKNLGLDYIDMYLIHTPWTIKEDPEKYIAKEENGDVVYEDTDHIAVWKEMEKQVKAARAKSIGLSNFNQSQILNVYNKAEIKPSNLQIESHAYLHQDELRKFCKEHNIVITAYAPLGSNEVRSKLYKNTDKDLPSLMDLPVVKEIAEKYKKTPGQILLRHIVQDGLVVIPKSSNSERQKSNMDIFDFKLTDEEMKKLHDLDKGEKGRVFDFLAFMKDIGKNPEYPWVSGL